MKLYSWSYKATAIIASLLIVSGIILRADEVWNSREYKLLLSLEKFKFVWIGLFFVFFFLLITAVFYRQTLSEYCAFFLPILLVAGVITNIGLFRKTNEQGMWHLRRLTTNSIVDLVRESPREDRALYFIIGQFYRGKEILLSHKIIEADVLSPRLFEEWAGVEISIVHIDNENWSKEKARQILSLEHTAFVLKDKKYLFITENLTETEIVVLVEENNQMFFIPYNLIQEEISLP